MDRNKQDIRYEELYNRLLERGVSLHENNRKRIRIGLIFLILRRCARKCIAASRRDMMRYSPTI